MREDSRLAFPRFCCSYNCRKSLAIELQNRVSANMVAKPTRRAVIPPIDTWRCVTRWERLKSALLPKAQKVFEICSGRYEKLTKSSETPIRYLLCSEIHFRSSDIACWDKRERFVWSIRFLLS